MGPIGAENKKRREEELERQAAIAAEEAKAPPASHGRMTWAKKLRLERKRDQLLEQIKSPNSAIIDRSIDENEWTLV